MTTETLLSRRAYAKARHRAPSHIMRKVADGTIELVRPCPSCGATAALKAESCPSCGAALPALDARQGKIDPVAADAALAASADPRHDATRARHAQRRPEDAPATVSPETPTPTPTPKRETVNSAKTRREIALADEAELKLAERRGEVCTRAGIEREALAAGRQLQSVLMQLPDRLAQRLAPVTDPKVIRAELDEAITGALNQFIEGYRDGQHGRA